MRPNLRMFSQASNISDRFLTFDIFAHYGPKCNFFYLFFIEGLSICYWLLKCRVLRIVCVLACVREGDTVTSQPRLVCKQVSVTRLCSPLWLELMVKLRTLLTVFTFILKAKSRDYGMGHYITDSCLWCSANHCALGQLANQSKLCLSERGGTL